MDGLIQFLRQHGSTLTIIALGITVIGLTVIYGWAAFRGNPETVKMLANTTFGTYSKVTALAPLGCPTNDNTKLCDYYIEKNLINGCGKPFKVIKDVDNNYVAIVCEYI